MRNIVILNSLHFSYPLPILMRVSYNTLIVKQNTSDYYKYMDKKREIGERYIYKTNGASVIVKEYCDYSNYNVGPVKM